MSLSIALSPGGHLFVQPDDQAEPKLSQATAARLSEAFSVSAARGLETLASEFLHEPLPPTFVFWRGFAQRLFAALCHNSSLENASTIVISKPVETELTAMAESAPPMTGLEYLNSAILRRLWDELDAYVHAAIGRTPGGGAGVSEELQSDVERGGARHVSLGGKQAQSGVSVCLSGDLHESDFRAGQGAAFAAGPGAGGIRRGQKPAALAALLSPVQRAAEQSKLARELLDSRAIFHPQVWRPDQAFAFLQNIPLFEQSGLVVRIPDWWKAGRPPRPQVSVRIGEAKGNLLGKESLLDFQVNLSLEGESLTESELNAILQSTSGLVLLKGKWVEVDKEKLQQVLDHWKKVQSDAGPDGLPSAGRSAAVVRLSVRASRASRRPRRRRRIGRAWWRAARSKKCWTRCSNRAFPVNPTRAPICRRSCVRISGKGRIGSGS